MIVAERRGSALRNSAALVVAKGALAGARVAFLLWAASKLGPEGFGGLALCFSIIEILRIVADFGTESFFVRALARANDISEQRDLLAQMGAFRLVTTTLALVIYATAVGLFFADLVGFLEAGPAALLVAALGINYVLTFYQAELRVERVALLMGAVAAPFVVLAVLLRDGPIELHLCLLIAYELSTCGALFMDLRRRTQIDWRNVGRAGTALTLRNTAKSSFHLAASALLVTGYTRLDVFALQHFAGVAAVGLYSFAYRVTEPFRFLGGAIDSTLYSYLSGRFAKPAMSASPAIMHLTFLVSMYALLFGLAAIGVGFALTASGYADYTPARTTLLVLGVTLTLRCANGAMSAFQNALGNYQLILRFSLFNALLMAFLIWPFTARFGAFGAALALLIVESVNFCMQAHFFLRNVRALQSGKTQ